MSDLPCWQQSTVQAWLRVRLFRPVNGANDPAWVSHREHIVWKTPGDDTAKLQRGCAIRSLRPGKGLLQNRPTHRTRSCFTSTLQKCLDSESISKDAFCIPACQKHAQPGSPLLESPLSPGSSF